MRTIWALFEYVSKNQKSAKNAVWELKEALV